MNLFATIEDKWELLCRKTQPFRTKAGEVWRKVCRFFRIAWAYIYKLRSLLLAAPVLIAAVWLACSNLVKLPDEVGIHLLSSGEFFMTVPKLVAALGPLAVTVLCVVLTLCSRKTLYPWMISIFTLALPLLILVTNIYPV